MCIKRSCPNCMAIEAEAAVLAAGVEELVTNMQAQARIDAAMVDLYRDAIRGVINATWAEGKVKHLQFVLDTHTQLDIQARLKARAHLKIVQTIHDCHGEKKAVHKDDAACEGGSDETKN